MGQSIIMMAGIVPVGGAMSSCPVYTRSTVAAFFFDAAAAAGCSAGWRSSRRRSSGHSCTVTCEEGDTGAQLPRFCP